MAQDRQFEVKVEEVHSGDDLVLMVDLGVDGLHKRVRARLKGVDTPSAFRAKCDTEAGAVRDTLKSLVSRGPARVVLHSYGRGGWLVTLLILPERSAELNVNDLLMQQGYVYQSAGQESK